MLKLKSRLTAKGEKCCDAEALSYFALRVRPNIRRMKKYSPTQNGESVRKCAQSGGSQLVE